MFYRVLTPCSNAPANASYQPYQNSPDCAYTCTPPAYYKQNTDFTQNSYAAGAAVCAPVPIGFWSPANDNGLYPCTNYQGHPPPFYQFTSGAATDACAVGLALQAVASVSDILPLLPADGMPSTSVYADLLLIDS